MRAPFRRRSPTGPVRFGFPAVGGTASTEPAEPADRSAVVPGDRGRQSGAAVVEFAIASFVFLFMVFATVDFGRAIFVYAELQHGVRDAAREMKVKTANGDNGGAISQSAIQNRVRRFRNIETNGNGAFRPGLTQATATFSCAGGCTSGNRLSIAAAVPFTAVTQEFLGIGPLTLSASTSLILE